MQSTQNDEIFKRMVLTIPDLVLPQNIPTIINWFDYYGIADVKNVDVREHPEQEYYVEDRPFYGYAVIEIREWYKNNGSLSFYENLIGGSAKMVYEDPEYWDVEFYEPRTQEEENTIAQNLQEKFDEVEDDKDEEYYSEEEYSAAEAQEAKERMESDEQEDEDDGEHEDDGEDEDDPKDEDYEFEETDEEEDSKYEYVARKRHKMDTRSKTKRKEDKSKVNSLNTENVTLEELIVKKNKNYVKRDKRKSFKNEWSRRLRQKLEV